MTPAFKIIANEQDVSDRIREHLISGTLTDNEGMKSDTLEIQLRDRDGTLQIPPSGTELKFHLGYWETGTVYKGLFIYDGDYGIRPDRIILRATAAHLGNSETLKGFKATLKSHKTRSWHQQTLGAIVQAIAAEHGYKGRVHSDFTEELIQHVDQTDESDLNFLTRLARDRNAVAKPAGGFLVFVPRKKGLSVTGQQLATLSLQKADLSSWSLDRDERGRYQSVEAGWTDLGTGDRITETAGAGEPVKKLRGTFPSKAEAMQSAEAELRRIELAKAQPKFSFAGWPEIGAEGLVNIAGLRDEMNGTWSITKATHSFSDTGYTTSIDCELPEDD